MKRMLISFALFSMLSVDVFAMQQGAPAQGAPDQAPVGRFGRACAKMSAVADTATEIGKGLALGAGSLVAYSLVPKDLIAALIKGRFNPEYWKHNCFAAYERGGLDWIRAALTCPMFGIENYTSEIAATVLCVVLVAVAAKKIKNKLN